MSWLRKLPAAAVATVLATAATSVAQAAPDLRITQPRPVRLAAFGTSIAHWNGTLVVGAPNAPSASRVFPPGSATVFSPGGSGLVGRTLPTGTTNDRCGEHVGIVGNVVAVGCVQDPTVKVYRNAATGPVATATLSVPHSRPGLWMAMAGDTIAATVMRGEVRTTFIYQRPRDGWRDMAPTAVLRSATGRRDSILATATDGRTVAVSSARFSDQGDLTASRVELYERTAGGWRNSSPTATLASPAAGTKAAFGLALAVRGDTLAVSAPFTRPTQPVYVYRRAGARWGSALRPAARLVPSGPGVGDKWGAAVDLSGNMIVVGSPRYTGGPGNAWFYPRPSGGWHTAAESARINAVGIGGSTELMGPRVALGTPLVAVGGRPSAGAVAIYRTPAPRTWLSVAGVRTGRLAAGRAAVLTRSTSTNGTVSVTARCAVRGKRVKARVCGLTKLVRQQSPGAAVTQVRARPACRAGLTVTVMITSRAVLAPARSWRRTWRQTPC